MSDPLSMSVDSFTRRRFWEDIYNVALCWKQSITSRLDETAFRAINRRAETDQGDIGYIPDILAHAFICAIQVGLPATPETVSRLLGDREFFFDHLPVPADDPRWMRGQDFGAGFLLIWWWQNDNAESFRAPTAQAVAQIPNTAILEDFLFDA